MKEVKIYSLAVFMGDFVVLLEEKDGNRLLPIWIGPAEGNAIAAKLANIEFPRPLTHDLYKNTLIALGATIQKVIVNDIRDRTFYAVICLKFEDKIKEIDSRPSDAIALALRFNVPIFVEGKVFEKSQTLLKPITKEEVEEFKKKVKHLKPEDIFKDIIQKQKENPEK